MAPHFRNITTGVLVAHSIMPPASTRGNMGFPRGNVPDTTPGNISSIPSDQWADWSKIRP